MNYPKSVVIGDITVRDGYQHEEKFIPTEAKLWMLEQLLLAGFKHLEVTTSIRNFLNLVRNVLQSH